MRSLGVDVSVRRGLDLVLLDGSPEPVAIRSRVAVEELASHVRKLRPDVVAVDSPPARGLRGGLRESERVLRAMNIQSYGTPSNPEQWERPFYGWMKVGQRTFGILEATSFPRYRGGPVRATAIEVFPHATAVVLAGCLQPPAVPKHTWRASILRAHGIRVGRLRTPDLIDAALAALTGLYALRGEFIPVGDPEEGVIVLPVGERPTGPYRRCTESPSPEPQLRLPGLSPCTCGHPGCRQMTSNEFAPGHDTKRKALLWQQARRGEDAVEELKRRGWELPPELR